MRGEGEKWTVIGGIRGKRLPWKHNKIYPTDRALLILWIWCLFTLPTLHRSHSGPIWIDTVMATALKDFIVCVVESEVRGTRQLAQATCWDQHLPSVSSSHQELTTSTPYILPGGVHLILFALVPRPTWIFKYRGIHGD